MDPVPLGLGLALVAIILYLFKELGEKQRALSFAQMQLEEFERRFGAEREIPASRRAAVEDQRRHEVSEGTLIEGTAVRS